MQVMGWGKGVGSIESAWKTRAFMFFSFYNSIINWSFFIFPDN